MASSDFSLMASSGFSLMALFKSEQEQRNVKTRKMATIILRISPPFIRLHCYHNYLGKNINDNGLKSSTFVEVGFLCSTGSCLHGNLKENIMPNLIMFRPVINELPDKRNSQQGVLTGQGVCLPCW
jgi:hypothetical protein